METPKMHDPSDSNEGENNFTNENLNEQEGLNYPDNLDEYEKEERNKILEMYKSKGAKHTIDYLENLIKDNHDNSMHEREQNRLKGSYLYNSPSQNYDNFLYSLKNEIGDTPEAKKNEEERQKFNLEIEKTKRVKLSDINKEVFAPESRTVSIDSNTTVDYFMLKDGSWVIALSWPGCFNGDPDTEFQVLYHEVTREWPFDNIENN